jgi:serine/threonine protein kinase
MRCANCQEELKPHYRKCPVCDTPVSGPVACRSCGEELKPHYRKCPMCDTPTSTSLSPPPGSATSLKDSGLGAPWAKDSLAPSGGAGVPDLTGDVLNDQFEIKRLLGRGGFGPVYLAYDRELQQEVALKVVAVQPGQGEAYRRQLSHEFQLRRKIHENRHVLQGSSPVKVTHKGAELVLLPMDYAQGGSLREWMVEHRDRKERETEGVELFRQACRGVAAIHEAGLLHLDLKPENLLLERRGKDAWTVKVTDFGLGRDTNRLSMMSAELRQDGVGTPGYMSPEQIDTANWRDLDKGADIYALGCILCELLIDTVPYTGDNAKVKEQHRAGVKPKLKGLEGPFRDTVFMCIETDEANRPASIADLLHKIDGKEPSADGGSLPELVGCPLCHGSSVPCYMCKGKGSELCGDEKPECSWCVGGKLGVDVCPICMGQGKVPDAGVKACPVCGATGLVECLSCEGKGSCSICEGKACYSCDGKGDETCWGCKGTGNDFDGIRTSTCNKCAGKGRLTCEKCAGTGTRRKQCNHCHGSNKCLECKGSGTQNCFACGGTRLINPLIAAWDVYALFISRRDRDRLLRYLPTAFMEVPSGNQQGMARMLVHDMLIKRIDAEAVRKIIMTTKMKLRKSLPEVVHCKCGAEYFNLGEEGGREHFCYSCRFNLAALRKDINIDISRRKAQQGTVQDHERCQGFAHLMGKWVQGSLVCVNCGQRFCEECAGEMVHDKTNWLCRGCSTVRDINSLKGKTYTLHYRK